MSIGPSPAHRKHVCKRRLAPIARLLLALCFLYHIGTAVAGEQVLDISQDGSDAPTVVSVVGPQSLLDRVAQVAKLRRNCAEIHGFIGQSFSIDWGDDDRYGTNAEPPILGRDGCEDWLKHRYTVPGIYRIQASLDHLGPTDIGVIDWQSDASVTVGGTPAALDFSLIAPATDRTFLYEERVHIAWTLATGAPADLRLDLIDKDGVVAVSQSLTGLTYVGRGETYLGLQGPKYDALVRNDFAKARLRVVISSGGETLIRESVPFTLSNEMTSALEEYSPRAELVWYQPRKIEFSHHTFFMTCHSYVLDWGDGSPVERGTIVDPPNDCVLKGDWIRTRHIYATPGQYRIVLRVNDDSLKEPPDDSPFYQAVTIDVP